MSMESWRFPESTSDTRARDPMYASKSRGVNPFSCILYLMAAIGSEISTGKCFSSNCSISVASISMLSFRLGAFGKRINFASSAFALCKPAVVLIGLIATVFTPDWAFGQKKRVALNRCQQHHIVRKVEEGYDTHA